MRKKIFRSIIICIILLLAVILLSGCTGYRDAESTLLVAGIAVDYSLDTADGKKYLVTAEILPMKGNSDNQEPYSYVISQSGDTFVEALRLLAAKTSKPLFYGHCKLLLISEAVAEDGFLSIIEVVFRDNKLRFPITVAISKGSSAELALNTKASVNDTNAYGITEMIKSTYENVSIAPHVQLLEFINSMYDTNKSCVLPYIVLTKAPDESYIPSVGGAAIIRDYKLIGYFNKENGLFFSLAADQFKQGVINCTIPSEKRVFPFKVVSNETAIKCDTSDNELSVTFDINTTVSIMELPIREIAEDEEFQEQFFKEAAFFISQNTFSVIKDTIDRYGVEVFGITRATRSQCPKFWKKNMNNWDDVIKSAKIIVKASISLKTNDVSGKKF